jgi:DNA mismatch endonuclease (patch repair protein)
MTAKILQPAPGASSEKVRKAMQAIRSKNTVPELLFRRALSQAGIRGYRVHWKKAPGRPDIAFVGKRVAVFVMGCFWHRCPRCALPNPKTNREWWQQKFNGNLERDRRVQSLLKAEGWTTVIIWECEARENIA